MKVVFLFMSQSSAPPGSTKRTYPIQKCGRKYHDIFKGEGYFKLLQYFVDIGLITDLKIFYESNIQPGIAKWVIGKNVYCEVIPEIRFVDEYIEKDTIIFVRGGFKHWHDFLVKYKHENWLMIYAANTGRQKWTWWDVVLNDLTEDNYVDRWERYQFPFVKPIDEAVFYSRIDKKKIFDFCIGASHIHDKKGQYRVIEAINLYIEKYGNNIKAILPGAPRRSSKTVISLNHTLPRLKDNINYCGYVDRNELANIFNSSKFFIHLGTHGQNDRGPLEALACGAPVIIGSPGHHAPYFRRSFSCYNNFPFMENFEKVADFLHYLLNEYYTQYRHIEASLVYARKNSFYGVVIPRMQILFEMMKELKPNVHSKTMIKEEIRRKVSRREIKI